MKQPFFIQKDFADCGAVCLQNILSYYKIDLPLEMLRAMSGTGHDGATLLGLYQAAEELGFTPMGAEAEKIDNLAEVAHPCILHLTIEDRFYHYVIYYPPNPGRPGYGEPQTLFTIGDPSAGIEQWDRSMLDERWRSKALLLLRPTGKLQSRSQLGKSKWSWLAGIVKKDLDLLYLAGFLGLIIAVLNLSTAVYSQKLVDNILPRHQAQKVCLATALFGVLLIVKCGLSRLRGLLLAKQSYRFNINLTAYFLGSLLYLPKSFFDSRKTGDLTSRLNDIGRIQQALSFIVGDISVQALFLVAALGLAFSYSLAAGFGCLLVLPIQFCVVRRHESHLLAGYRDAMKANAAKETSYIDIVKGITTIKTLNKEQIFLTDGNAKMDVFQRSLFKLAHRRIKFVFDNDLVGTLFMTFIVLSCALSVNAGKMTTGQLFAIVQMTVYFLQAAGALALTNLNLQEAKAALERIVEFNHISPEHAPSPISPIIRPYFKQLIARNISFRFRGRSPLLKDISFEVAKGEIISIVGESGQGKSTLFQLLERMYPPETGSISINGEDWGSCETAAWRNLIGVVPQEITVFAGTLYENIAFDEASGKPGKVVDFCRRFGFEKHFSRLRHGGNTVLGEGGIRLSGGEKQMLGLARCLYRQPELVLLDEPTSAMDATLRQWVNRLLQELKPQMGIIVISHQDEWVGRADRTYYLHDGVLHKKKLPCLEA